MKKKQYNYVDFNNNIDDNNFSQSQTNFYPKYNLKTESNILSTKNITSKNPKYNTINENIEDRIYVEDADISMNYIGKPIINSNLYEFTCYETKEKYLAKRGNLYNISKEANILKNLNHKNILKWKRYFTEDNNIYMLYENYGNITLEEYMKQKKILSENEVKYIITELIDLLIYLKKHNIIHRNLRLSNIIVNKKGEIKVMGFDSAVKLYPGQNSIEEKTDINGNYVFSPESSLLYLYLSKKDTMFFSYETDLWAVGKIMFSLLVGELPKNKENSNKHEIYEINVDISYKAADCIKRLMEPNPKDRIRLNQVFLLPFFKEI